MAISPRLLVPRASGTTPWYLLGGIPRANCMAAYAPKGAASAAAALVNIASPGTYDLTPVDGTGAPASASWNATTGLTADNPLCYLTGLNPAGTNKAWSFLLRVTFDATYRTGYLCGCWSSVAYSKNFGIYTASSGLYTQFHYGGYIADVGCGQSGGVFGIAGADPYFNGVDKGTISAGTPVDASLTNFALGGIYKYDGTTPGFFTCRIQAAALYNTVLTAAQMAAVSTAMAAL